MMLQAMYAQMQTMSTPSMDGQSMMGGLPRLGSFVNENMRPESPRTRSMVNLARPQAAPRTMSMVNSSSPFAQNWSGPGEPLINSAGSVYNINLDGGYAASVAPSERSNVGQPHRYRPVSSLKFDTASTVMGVSSRPGSRGSDAGTKKKKSGFFSAIMHPKGKTVDVDEEEEDWSNFAKKRRSAMPSQF